MILASEGEELTMAAIRPRFFTFWEPRGGVTPYLQLCRETWQRGLPSAEVVTLDYANLDQYLPPGTLDIATLQRFPLMQVKDAVMVAILHRHGGLFIDMDTLIVDDISPFMASLERTTMFNFGGSLSVVGARAGSRLLTLWLDRVRERLALVASGRVDAAKVSWSYIGYETLHEVHVQLRDAAWHRRVIRSTAPGRRLWAAAARIKPPRGKRGSLWRRIPRRIEWELTRRAIARHRIQFGTQGFFAELQDDRDRTIDRITYYRQFWDDPVTPVETVVKPGVPVIALHNSWTPDWYAALSREEVLAHGSLLSRTLRHLLAT